MANGACALISQISIKACPKDSYPLPSIDELVDGASGNELLSMMDAHSGYNQILMHEPDEEKTSFITDSGTFCYRVMPFGLRNAGATFQRLMDKVFVDQIGRNVSAYVDDILVKSTSVEKHPEDLRETLRTLKKYGMKLNPSKCSFGIKEGKFLGFYVGQHGIKPNPDKIQAILDMEAPRTIREVQRLNGRINALSRFISQTADKCKPFFQLLKTAAKGSITWTTECEEAFTKLKAHMSSLPMLTSPRDGEDLYLYIAASEEAVSAVLIAQRDKEQVPIYYHSRRLQGAEIRYSPIEKIVYAVIHACRRFRAYFLAHTIVVLTSCPLRRLLHKPDISGRLTKWAIELSEFDLDFRPATAIKGQAVADFMVELTPSNLAQPWTVEVDGSSCSTSSGIGVKIHSPDEKNYEHSIRLHFPASNNVAEYEAAIHGLKLLRTLGAEKVTLRTDSQLVARQNTGEFACKEPQITKYVETMVELTKQFAEFKIEQIPRT